MFSCIFLTLEHNHSVQDPLEVVQNKSLFLCPHQTHVRKNEEKHSASVILRCFGVYALLAEF